MLLACRLVRWVIEHVPSVLYDWGGDLGMRRKVAWSGQHGWEADAIDHPECSQVGMDASNDGVQDLRTAVF